VVDRSASTDLSLEARGRRSQESIPHPRYGHDPFAAIVALSQRLPQRRNLNGKVAFFDDDPRPASLHQVGDNIIGVDQCRQQGKAALADGNSFAILQ
jgi:hypothetical protein